MKKTYDTVKCACCEEIILRDKSVPTTDGNSYVCEECAENGNDYETTR